MPRISVVPADLEDRFTVFADGGVVSVLQSLTTATTLSLYIRASENISGADRSATLLLTVAAVDPPVFAAVLDDASPRFSPATAVWLLKLIATAGGGVTPTVCKTALATMSTLRLDRQTGD